MTILVTGSSGLIGTALIEALTAQGQPVVRLVRPSSGTSPSRAAATGIATPMTVDWDPGRGTVDFRRLEEAGPFEGVVHLAGAGVGDKRWSQARKDTLVSSRIDSTSLLIATLLQLAPRPPVLISASAIGYYGDRGPEELTESSTRGIGFLANLTEAWEGAARPADAAGIRVVTLRTGLVLASGGGVLGKLLPLFRLGVGGKLGSGQQYMSWIAIEDEVAIILRALSDGRLSGPINAVAPEPVTNAEFTSVLGSVVHRPTLLSVPATGLRVALGRQMADEMLLAGQRVLPAALDAVGFQFNQPQLRPALEAITG